MSERSSTFWWEHTHLFKDQQLTYVSLSLLFKWEMSEMELQACKTGTLLSCKAFRCMLCCFFPTKWCSLVAWTPIGSGVSSSYHSATKGPFLKQVRKGHAVSWISLCIFNRWVWSNLFMYFLLWMTFRQLLTTPLVYVTHKTRTVNKDPKDVVKSLPSIATRKNKV